MVSDSRRGIFPLALMCVTAFAPLQLHGQTTGYEPRERRWRPDF